LSSRRNDTRTNVEALSFEGGSIVAGGRPCNWTLQSFCDRVTRHGLIASTLSRGIIVFGLGGILATCRGPIGSIVSSSILTPDAMPDKWVDKLSSPDVTAWFDAVRDLEPQFRLQVAYVAMGLDARCEPSDYIAAIVSLLRFSQASCALTSPPSENAYNPQEFRRGTTTGNARQPICRGPVEVSEPQGTNRGRCGHIDRPRRTAGCKLARRCRKHPPGVFDSSEVPLDQDGLRGTSRCK
jgi:hypothetical protein